MNSKKAALTGIIMFFAVTASKFLGLIRDSLMAKTFGVDTAEAFAIATASRIPLIFLELALGTAIMGTFIPVYAEVREREGNEKAQLFANNFINIIGAITFIICIIGVAFSRGIVGMMTTNLEANVLNLTATMLQILFPTLFFASIAFCFVGLLQSNGRFNIPAAVSAISNLIVASYLYFFGAKFGAFGVALAILIGWGSQIIVQIPSLIKTKYRYKFTINFKDPAIKKVAILAAPILVSAWVQPINNIINLKFASAIDTSATLVLDYANRLYLIVAGIFVYTVTNMAFPELSKLSVSGNDEAFSQTLQKALKVAIFIVAPVLVGIVLLKNPIINIIYLGEEFTQEAADRTANVLMIYSFGIIGFAICEVVTKAFFAMQKAIYPMIISVVGIVANIAICFFAPGFRESGIAFAACVSINLIGLMQLLVFHFKFHRLINLGLIISLVKTAFAAAVMGVAVYFIYGFLQNSNQLLALSISGISAVIIYFGTAILIKADTMTELLKGLRKKGA